MGILGKAIAYKVVKNRAERKAEDEARARYEREATICDNCGRPRRDHAYRMFKYMCPR